MDDSTMIKAYAGTMRHIIEGLDVVGDDIVEMARRLQNQPRRGQNAKSLESELGIHGHKNETIKIILGTPSDSSKIIVEHSISKTRIWVSYDDDIVVRTPFPADKWYSIPDSVRDGYEGRPLECLIDFSNTSIPDIGRCPIKSIYYNVNDREEIVIYVKAPITKYLARTIKELSR